MAQAIGVGHDMVRLQALVVLVLRGMLVLMLRVLVVVEDIGHAPASTIQPAIMALLMVLGVHARVVSGTVFLRLVGEWFREVGDGDCGCEEVESGHGWRRRQASVAKYGSQVFDVGGHET